MNGVFDLHSIIGKRESKDTFLMKFLYHFVPTIIGYDKWKETKCSKNISELLTVSNEVFLYFTIENNYDRWLFNQNITVSVKMLFDIDDHVLTLNDIYR